MCAGLKCFQLELTADLGVQATTESAQEVEYFLADYIFWTTFLLLLSLDLERRSDIFKYTYLKGKQK
jgi:hypothetical protein